MQYHHKQRRIGAGIVIACQILIGCVGIGGFFRYYDQLTENKSTVQAYETTVTLPTIATETKVEKSDTKIAYEGVFGEIQQKRQESTGTVFDFQAKSTEVVTIDSNKLLLYHMVLKLVQDHKIDNAMANFLLEAKEPQQAINDIIFLQQYTQTTIQPEDIPTQDILQPYIHLIEAKEYEKLITTFENLESMVPVAFRNNTATTMQLHTRFTRHTNFAYIQENFIDDTNNVYSTHINTVADIFGIDPKLIQAAILGEQIRGFFTYRGVAKQLLKDNLQIMSMGQGSYGIGGVKLDTAEHIEQRLQTNYPDTRATYFAYPNNETDIAQARQVRLESSQNYFFHVLYVGAILKEILDTRKHAGFDISAQPGIILTLYNIGNKTPHESPEVGGAVIEIEGEQYTFGSVAMLMYYRLNIY